MRVERLSGTPDEVVARIRALVPGGSSVRRDVEAIVDLTATGTTLRENGLVIREEIGPSTARLIANPVAHRLKAAEIDGLLERIRGAVAA